MSLKSIFGAKVHNEMLDILNHTSVADITDPAFFGPGRLQLASDSVHHGQTPSTAQQFQAGALKIRSVVQVSFGHVLAQTIDLSRRKRVGFSVPAPFFDLDIVSRRGEGS